jgi:hypothetical protein
MRLLFLIAAALIAIMTNTLNCGGHEIHSSIRKITEPYQFSMAEWMLETNFNNIKQKIFDSRDESEITTDNVVRYFDLINRRGATENTLIASMNEGGSEAAAEIKNRLSKLDEEIEYLKPIAEHVISGQITEILKEEEIMNPAANLGDIIFPAVYFELDKPMYTFMVSPRDRIERISETLLKGDNSLEQLEILENTAEEMNVSALAIRLGGLGATYPSFVTEYGNLKFTLNAAAEEWLHQYLAFRPLGFHYVLDLLNISSDADIATLNETIAGIAAKEIGGKVYDRYYAAYYPSNEENNGEDRGGTVFDFNEHMRSVRLQVDAFLAGNSIEEAELFMNEQRDYLLQQGYYIRKLNQAYFAFYGSYADSPSAVDPIGNHARTLRSNSESLKEFMETASGITTREELKAYTVSLR